MKACIKYYFFSHGSCKSSLAVGLSSGNQESILRRNRRKPCLSGFGWVMQSLIRFRPSRCAHRRCKRIDCWAAVRTVKSPQTMPAYQQV